MATNQYTTVRKRFAVASTLEEELTKLHGDLHVVIPALSAKHGQPEAARLMSTDEVYVSTSWVNRWLHRHGYERRVTYVRKDAVSS